MSRIVADFGDPKAAGANSLEVKRRPPRKLLRGDLASGQIPSSSTSPGCHKEGIGESPADWIPKACSKLDPNAEKEGLKTRWSPLIPPREAKLYNKSACSYVTGSPNLRFDCILYTVITSLPVCILQDLE